MCLRVRCMGLTAGARPCVLSEAGLEAALSGRLGHRCISCPLRAPGDSLRGGSHVPTLFWGIPVHSFLLQTQVLLERCPASGTGL